jgi:hypothetical protein
MATSYTWPSSLPAPLFGSFSEDSGMNVLQTPMDAGPAKIRKRSNRASKMQMSFSLTDSQVTTLETFVQTTISGVARFAFTHPRTGNAVEARIVPSSDGSFYQLSQSGTSRWNVSISMEVLP